WGAKCFLRRHWRVSTRTSSAAIFPEAPSRFGSFFSVRPGGITVHRQGTSTFAHRQLRRAAECMACAAIMRQRWRCRSCVPEKLKVNSLRAACAIVAHGQPAVPVAFAHDPAPHGEIDEGTKQIVGNPPRSTGVEQA